ncbi:MAG: FxsA family protein, partial [Pseudomonadales bacterium]|nr:FxsA family protein [Pseudomonadales bacterium]
EGLATLARVQEKLARDQLPETELLEGVMLLIGGALLLTPGFVTDAIGFCCLLPGTRRPIARWILNQGMLTAMRFGNRTWMHGEFTDHTYEEHRDGNRTIEGDYRDDDEERK